MSSYVNFYVEQNGVYIHLNSYSRSNPMYQILSDMVPYEKGIELTDSLLKEAVEDFEADISHDKKRIIEIKEILNTISSMEGSIEDKIAAIEERRELIEEYEDDIVMKENQLTQLRFMEAIRDPYTTPEIKVWVGVEWDPNYKEDENE